MKLEKQIDQLKSLEVQVLAVSKDEPKNTQKLETKMKGKITFISDSHGELIASLGLLDKGGNPFNGSDVARISKMLVNEKQELLWFRFTENSRVRISSNELIDELSKAIKSYK